MVSGGYLKYQEDNFFKILFFKFFPGCFGEITLESIWLANHYAVHLKLIQNNNECKL